MPSFKEVDEARKLLGLEEKASLGEIKKAYRKKANSYHPDKGGGDGEKMKELNLAYEIIERYCACSKISFEKEAWKRACPGDAWEDNYKGFF